MCQSHSQHTDMYVDSYTFWSYIRLQLTHMGRKRDLRICWSSSRLDISDDILWNNLSRVYHPVYTDVNPSTSHPQDTQTDRSLHMSSNRLFTARCNVTTVTESYRCVTFVPTNLRPFELKQHLFLLLNESSYPIAHIFQRLKIPLLLTSIPRLKSVWLRKVWRSV